jgi:8-oxo-dGTP pyrophosphatase MutT (NUDIX family)
MPLAARALALADQPAMFIVNVQVAVVAGDKLLVIRRDPGEGHAAGALDLPGGKVDAGEILPGVLENVARREVLEETGVQLDCELRYVCSASFRMPDGTSVVNVVFAASVPDAPAALMQPGETTYAGWMALAAALADETLPPWTAGYVRQAFPDLA